VCKPKVSRGPGHPVEQRREVGVRGVRRLGADVPRVDPAAALGHRRPAAGEEAAHRQRQGGPRLPGQGHALLPQHDPLQAPPRLRPRPAGQDRRRHQALQGK